MSSTKTNIVSLTTRVPEAPDTLHDAGKDEWNRIAPILHSRGTLTADRLMLFENYCTEAAQVKAYNLALKNEPLTITGPKGVSVAHPLIRPRSKAVHNMTQMAKQLGIIGPNAPEKSKNVGIDSYSELGIT